MATEILAAWLLTVALHSSVLLGIAWLLDRGALRARPAWREVLWRAALFGGVVTAGVQVLLDVPMPARIALATTAPATTSSAVIADLRSTADSSTSREASRAPVAEPVAGTARKGTAASIANPVQSPSRATRADVPAIASARTPFALPSWHLILIAGWLSGALIALTRFAAAWMHLRRSLALTEPLANPQLATDAAALAIEARIAPPHLAVLDDLASPIAARGRIVLPRWAVELLDREQLRAMLAHETAHIARRDPEWKLATAAWQALFWFVPLAPLARRRLDEIAEVSCDAWAAVHLGDGRTLAECLAECAGRHLDDDMALAPAMAGRESPLLQRIDYLIAGAPMNIEKAGARAGFAAAVALALAALVLPGVRLRAEPPPPAPAAPSVPATPATPATPTTPASSGRHVHVSSDVSLGGQELTIAQVSDDDHDYRVKIKGKITFNDSEDDIASLSSGGKATFSETRDGRTQRLEVVSRGGALERRYFIDDNEQPASDEMRRWMARLIPTVIRETAIDAEGRVQRLRAKGGADAVLDEIARIESGYARGVYLRHLAAGGKLSSAEMTRALGLVDGIDSDYEKRNALAALAAVQPLDAAQQKLVLAQADKIGSDYERAELLVGLLPQLASAEDVHAAWLHAASGIGSDYEQRRALSAMLETGKPDEATLATVVGAAHTVGSDYERRTLLVNAIKRTRNAEALAPSYAEAAREIGSSHERREALMALIRAPGFGRVGASAVLDALADIGSDYDCREVLVALARTMPGDADLVARYRDVARQLSDYDRRQAESALDRFASS